jgi:hypothetical protein
MANLKKATILIALVLSLTCILMSRFLDYPISRTVLVLGVLIMAISASMVMLENKKVGYFLALFILYVIPLIFFPSQYFQREFADPQMLAFNHETRYVNGKITFFSGEHKSSYPLSYIMAKIAYDIISDAWFVDLAMSPLLTGMLFLCFTILLIRRNQHKVLALYCSGLIILSFFNDILGWWGYRSIAYLNMFVLLAFLVERGNRKTRSNLLIMILLALSIIMSESLMPIYLASMLLYTYILNKNHIMKEYARLIFIFYIAYQVAINFVSYVAYGGYVPLIQEEILTLAKNIFDPNLIIRKTVISRSLYYPMVDRWLFILSNMIIYVFIPFMLFLTLKRRYSLTKIFPFYIILAVTLVSQVAARIIPTIIIANVGSVLIYGLYPLITFAFILSSKKSAEEGNKHLLELLLILLLVSLPISVISISYPISYKDPITNIDEPRVSNYYSWYCENFLNNFWDGQTSVLYHESTHFQRMFLKPELEESHLNPSYNKWVKMYPLLPTIFENYAEGYEEINITSQNIIYAQLYWLLIYYG